MEQEKSLRYNTGKPQWSLVDFKSLEPMVRVMEYGCTKYSRDNWKKGLDTTQILESLSRHLFSLMSGEEVDPESGQLHIAHIMCNAMFWQYHYTKQLDHLELMNHLKESTENAIKYMSDPKGYYEETRKETN